MEKAKTANANHSASRHHGSIGVISYMGGVGKTTVAGLLGLYLAKRTRKKVLLIDLDPQGFLSLAFGLDPEAVGRRERTVYDLLCPGMLEYAGRGQSRNRRRVTPPSSCKRQTLSLLEGRASRARHMKGSRAGAEGDIWPHAFRPELKAAPENLRVIPGNFHLNGLNAEIGRMSDRVGKRRVEQFHDYCRQMLRQFEDEYEYVIVDFPPGISFLGRAMLQACSCYLTVTNLDKFSSCGAPLLMRKVREIMKPEKPRFLGYVLNCVDGAGDAAGIKVRGRQSAARTLDVAIGTSLNTAEKRVLGTSPELGGIPRLDAIRCLFEGNRAKHTFANLKRRTPGRPCVDEHMTVIAEKVIERAEAYEQGEGED